MGVFCKRRIRVSNLSLGGPYTKNDRGCFLANFKPNREIMQQIRHYTVEAKSYEPNGYNLYNMAGNVSEWTDSYDPNAYEYVSSMNPNVLDASINVR
jgi:formylglycine-generating enzyme required for sulfatase activity